MARKRASGKGSPWDHLGGNGRNCPAVSLREQRAQWLDINRHYQRRFGEGHEEDLDAYLKAHDALEAICRELATRRLWWLHWHLRRDMTMKCKCKL